MDNQTVDDSARLTTVGPRPSAGPEAELCVVHLIRRANGLAAFQGFVDSYRRHSAGVHHELAFVLKGFDDRDQEEAYRAVANGLRGSWLLVPDDGLDLGAYRRAALMLPHRRLVFLNSFSVIQAEDWLAKMASVASEPKIGAVSASGSWGSHASHLRYDLGLGGPYQTVFDDLLKTRQVFFALTPEQEATGSDASRQVSRWEAARMLGRYLIGFPEFPSPHLRTNCLLIERRLWLGVCPRVPRDKFAAHRLESGRRGITSRIRRRGLLAVVVGRDGRACEFDAWPESKTFWQGNQENLLVGDNQTRAYLHGNDTVRQVLSRYAWGPEADPGKAPLTSGPK